MNNPESSPENLVVKLWVRNRLGLHARSAAKIATLAGQFKASITLEKAGLQVAADSILDLLTLDCPAGTELIARAEGPEAAQALEALGTLFAERFGEM